MKARILVTDLITILLILLWGYAAISKWLEPRFIYQLTSSPLIGNSFGYVLYWLLPLTELIIAVMLVFPLTRKVGLQLSFALLALFTGYIIYILNFAAEIPCSCGGVISTLSWNEHLIFNAGFLVLTVIGVVLIRWERIRSGDSYTISKN